jgi:GTP-binding protein
MEIKTASYTATYVEVEKCPKEQMPEYAFIGRSNVGKSSLINYLCNHKGLAKVSGTPGKTQTINYFLINNNWNLVDLPGYGFAKVSKERREKWQKMIQHYLQKRTQLQYVFVLIDARIPPQKIDLDFIHSLGEKRIPFFIVFTKADKAAGLDTITNINLFKKTLSKTWVELPEMFVTSAEKKHGKEEILKAIAKANTEFQPEENQE